MERSQKALDRSSLDALEDLYRTVDQQVAALVDRHHERLHCGVGCHSCCVDDLTVFAIEAAYIAHHSSNTLEHAAPRGRCAFLDEQGACRIYAVRPYVCRTQGLPLRWLEEEPSSEPLEYRDICPLNEEGRPIEELTAAECWTLGPIEARLAGLQQAWAEGSMQRIPLRQLFQDNSEEPSQKPFPV